MRGMIKSENDKILVAHVQNHEQKIAQSRKLTSTEPGRIIPIGSARTAAKELTSECERQ
jgi:hypothetical protein